MKRGIKSKARQIVLCGLLLGAADVFADTEAVCRSAKDAYEQSVKLLSAGRQSDAEALLEKALMDWPDNGELLFARGVLYRSRWEKDGSAYCFEQVEPGNAGSMLTRAVSLSWLLDEKSDAQKNLGRLIQLSDTHSSDIYLLWLSAIQCREQAEGKLGKQQYKKLLSYFAVGPVMVHHTYANILTEYLEEYGEAMEHREIAVSMEPRGWTYQGMANTLRQMKRYEESCKIWEKAIELDPDDADYWRQWGNTLYEMQQYSDALGKCRKSLELDPSSGSTCYRIGMCKKNLKQYDDMLPAFVKAAEQGDSFAMFELGNCYFSGQGCETNVQEAVVWYKKAAETGRSNPAYHLGKLYAEGAGVDQDWAEAVRWYQIAAEKGHISALVALAECYENGRGVEKDQNEAERCYRKVLEKDPNNKLVRQRLYEGISIEAATLCEQGTRHLYGIGVEKDYTTAFKLFEKSAQLGNPEALYYLGLCYAGGNGVLADRGKACEWYSKAGNAGHCRAQVVLGRCYELGSGVSRDLAKAFEWYIKAAEQGDAEGMAEVASFYARGQCVEKDEKKAAEYFENAYKMPQKFPVVAREYALFLSACDDPQLRNPEKAVRIAEGMRDWMGNSNGWYDLAIIYAANGRYADAFGAVKQSIERWENQSPSSSAPVVWQDFLKTVATLIELEETDAAEFHAKAGAFCLSSRFAPKNFRDAFAHFEKSAEQGNATGLWRLASMYQNGWAVERDERKALELYQQAEQGVPDDFDMMISFAYFRLQCRDESIRSPEEVLKIAQRAVQQKETSQSLDILAYGHAALGQYSEAVQAAEKLAAWYRNGNPGREPPSTVLSRLEKYKKMAEAEVAAPGQ